MTRWANSLCVLALPIAILGCQGSGVSPEARRELAALERSLGALESAHPEDRGIRLEDLTRLEGADPRVAELKALCVSAYRSFAEANGLLAEARAKTRKAEAAIAGARVRVDAGTPLDETAREELTRSSQAARESLAAVNGALDRAEKLIQACELERARLRERFTAR